MDEHEAFEEQLRGLSPSMHRVDRDLLMFRAGQAAEQRDRSGLRGHAWQLASLVSSLIAVVLGGTLIIERGASPSTRSLAEPTGSARPIVADHAAPRPVTTPVARHRAVPRYSREAASEGTGWADYAALRDDLLRFGIDVLPNPVSAGPSRPDTVLSPRSWLPDQPSSGSLRHRLSGGDAQGGLL